MGLKVRATRQAATRAKILEVAERMFAVKGYEGTTIRDIAAAAELSTGAIFSNFADKADLFKVVTGAPPPDPAGFLRAIAKGELAGIAAAAEAARLHKALTGQDLVQVG